MRSLLARGVDGALRLPGADSWRACSRARECGNVRVDYSKYSNRAATLLALWLAVSSGSGCDNVLGIDENPSTPADGGGGTAASDTDASEGERGDATLDAVADSDGPGPLEPGDHAGANPDVTAPGLDGTVSRLDGTADVFAEAMPPGDEEGMGGALADATNDGPIEAQGEAILDSSVDGGDSVIYSSGDDADGSDSEGEVGDSGPCINVPASKIVLFGGDALSDNMLNDTWEWDGTNWSHVIPVTSPTGRWTALGAAHCGNAIVYGGSPDNSNTIDPDQWRWDGTNWTSLGDIAFATLDTSAAAFSGTIVQFGGLSSDLLSTADTWIWDGSTWSEPSLDAMSGPSARYWPMLATFDGDVVLFGGVQDDGTVLSDTWIWNGSTWIALNPVSSPPPTYGAVGGVAGSTLMMFGGIDGTYTTIADTWLWDGSTWSKSATTAPPPARSEASAATLTNRVVLFGGQDANGDPLGDTWEWDGTTWFEILVPGPPARFGSTMIAF